MCISSSLLALPMMQSCCAVSCFIPGLECPCVKQTIITFSYTYGPSRGSLTIEFSHNFTLHQFLETTRILIVHLPTQKTAYPRPTPRCHFRLYTSSPKIPCNVVFCSSPTSFQKYTEMQASHISKLSSLEHTLSSPRFRGESLYTSFQTSMIFQLCKTVCVCDQVSRVFLVVEMSKDHWRLTLTAISCQASTWRSRLSRKMRLLHQLDLTMGLKKSSPKLCSVQID